MQTTEDVLESRGQATRGSILLAARKVFSRRGFHRATVDDITRQADVAHGTFYRYFRSKQDVLAGLMVRAIEELGLPDRTWQERDFGEALREDVRRYFANYVENRDLARIWVEAASYDEHIAEARRRLRAPFVARLSQAVEAGIRVGQMREVDTEVAAQALVSMIEGFAYQWFVLERRDDVDRAADGIATLWEGSLGVVRSGSPGVD